MCNKNHLQEEMMAQKTAQTLQKLTGEMVKQWKKWVSNVAL